MKRGGHVDRFDASDSCHFDSNWPPYISAVDAGFTHGCQYITGAHEIKRRKMDGPKGNGGAEVQSTRTTGSADPFREPVIQLVWTARTSWPSVEQGSEGRDNAAKVQPETDAPARTLSMPFRRTQRLLATTNSSRKPRSGLRRMRPGGRSPSSPSATPLAWMSTTPEPDFVVGATVGPPLRGGHLDIAERSRTASVPHLSISRSPALGLKAPAICAT